MRLPVFAGCDDKLFDARLAIAYRAGSRGLFGKTVATAYLSRINVHRDTMDFNILQVSRWYVICPARITNLPRRQTSQVHTRAIF